MNHPTSNLVEDNLDATAGMGSREGVGGNRQLSSSLFMSPIDGSAKANLFFAASLL